MTPNRRKARVPKIFAKYARFLPEMPRELSANVLDMSEDFAKMKRSSVGHECRRREEKLLSICGGVL
jgi:hypothetical protein